jgi:hypothetical protein
MRGEAHGLVAHITKKKSLLCHLCLFAIFENVFSVYRCSIGFTFNPNGPT